MIHTSGTKIIGTLIGGIALIGTASGTAIAATTGTINVPSDFDPSYSDTRDTGHFELSGTGLHIWTEGTTRTDKVAEYVATDTALAGVGEPSLDFDNTTSTGVPGFQLVVDFDDNGTADGILVGEPGAYGNDWWLTNSADQFVKDGAPVNSGGSGSAYHGTLDQWRTAFADANVVAFGFSLGSGVKGDGVLNTIDFAGVTYTFAADVALSGKDECKGGGWESSTAPTFTNQGQCVSYFAQRS